MHTLPPESDAALWLHLAGAAVRVLGAPELLGAVPDLILFAAKQPDPLAWPHLDLRFDVRPAWVNPDLTAPEVVRRSGGLAGNPLADLPDSGASLWPTKSAADGALGWARHDLRLVVCGSQADAVVDGSAAAFEAALQLTLQVALLPWGVLWVHGAAGVDSRGRAWLVPGASGAGKSTLTREAGWARALADEMVAVRLRIDGGFEVFGTPFWSHGRSLPLDAGSASLAVLALPVKASEPAVAALGEAEAAAHLLSQVALYEHSGAARTQAFELACAVAGQARCLALSFPRHGPWLRQVEVSLRRMLEVVHGPH